MTAQPCVTAPTGERRAQMRQYDPCGSVQCDGRTRPAEPNTYHRGRAEEPGAFHRTRAERVMSRSQLRCRFDSSTPKGLRMGGLIVPSPGAVSI